MHSKHLLLPAPVGFQSGALPGTLISAATICRPAEDGRLLAARKVRASTPKKQGSRSHFLVCSLCYVNKTRCHACAAQPPKTRNPEPFIVTVCWGAPTLHNSFPYHDRKCSPDCWLHKTVHVQVKRLCLGPTKRVRNGWFPLASL